MLINSPFKLLLVGVINLIAVFTLGSDFFSWMEMKKNQQTLEQLQIQKENILSKKIETSPQQTRLKPLIFLNPSAAGFTLARICETSKLFLTKIQLGKTPVKLKQNTFEVSLDLMGDYFGFIAFLNQLIALSWNIDWQTLSIAAAHSKTMKKTGSQTNQPINILYPLEIKLRLAIAHYYDPNKKIPQSTQASKLLVNNVCSPFTMRRHAGKLIIGGKTIDLIVAGEGENWSLRPFAE